MRALFACAFAIMLAAGRAAGQGGTIVYGWVAPLDVEAPGEMAAVRRAFESGARAPLVLHFTPTESLMVRGRPERPPEFSSATFRASNASLAVLERILDAWAAVEPNLLHQAYVGADGSGVKVLGSLGGGFHRVDTGVPLVEWTITDEQKTHLGHPVTVAFGEVGGERMEAWFAPDIPVSSGPAMYGGLPGMILMLSLDEGRTTYAATEVLLDGVEEGLIRVPEVGEARSQEEYQSIVAGEVTGFARHVRGMVRSFGNVRCTAGLVAADSRGMAVLQCSQSPGE